MLLLFKEKNYRIIHIKSLMHWWILNEILRKFEFFTLDFTIFFIISYLNFYYAIIIVKFMDQFVNNMEAADDHFQNFFLLNIRFE